MHTSTLTQKRSPGIIVMGVCGTGKSLIGSMLAERLDRSIFIEGDDFHPPENIERMKAGIPLTDQHRKGWLADLANTIEIHRQSQITVCSCSALKKKYRDQLRAISPDLIFIYLAGDKALIEQRMKAREHFMPSTLLDSQLSTLEPPQANEANVIECKINKTPPDIVTYLLTHKLTAWVLPSQTIEANYD